MKQLLVTLALLTFAVSPVFAADAVKPAANAAPTTTTTTETAKPAPATTTTTKHKKAHGKKHTKTESK